MEEDGNKHDTDGTPAAASMPPPAVISMPPPAAAMQPPPAIPAADAKSRGARSAAVAAAVAAVAQAAPGQRDRAVERAAAAAIAAAAAKGTQEGTEPRAGDAPAAAPGGQGAAAPSATYEPPSWSGVPHGVPYSIEILKGGAIVETRSVADKAFYTFGRHPTNDFVMEHPSSSRLHAVLQYRGATGEAYLYDCSAHGTWVNKQRIQAGEHVPLRVGDTIKFGSSTRLLVLCGPDELRPPEGLTRSQKLQLAQLEYSAKMQNKDKEAGKAAMEAALAGGATWGMGGPDAADDDDPDALGEIDWRALVAAGKLSEKQQKLAEKIRQKEYKMKNMQTEMERIQNKEKQEGQLTQGQAETLARIEANMDKHQAEVEDLEEELEDSIRDSMSAKLKEKARADEPKARRKRGTTASDDEYLEGSSSDDDFYDRTAAGGGVKRAKGAGAEAGGKSGHPVQQVESAQTLYGKKEVLQAERIALLAAIAEEEALVKAKQHSDQQQQQPAASGGPAMPDQGASDSTAAQGQQGTGNMEGMVTAKGDGPPGAASGAAGGTNVAEVDDSLDAFMSSMETQIEGDKLKSMRSQLSQLDAQLARAEKLLRIADPDGWLKPGSKTATAAKAAAQQLLDAERRRAAAAALAAKKQAAAAQEAAATFEDEDEEETDQPTSTATAPAAKPVITLRSQAPVRAAPQPGASAASAAAAGSGNSAAAAAAAQLIAEFSGQGTQQERLAEVLEVRMGPSVKKDRSKAGAGGLAALAGKVFSAAAGSVQAAAAAAEARVAEDMGALSAAERRRKELQKLEQQEREEAVAAKQLEAKHAAQQELQNKLGY